MYTQEIIAGLNRFSQQLFLDTYILQNYIYYIPNGSLQLYHPQSTTIHDLSSFHVTPRQSLVQTEAESRRLTQEAQALKDKQTLKK